jgi:hypothetical protein
MDWDVELLCKQRLGRDKLKQEERDTPVLESLRARLRGMTDEQLRKFGKAARYMVSPYANLGQSPLPVS